MASDGPNPERLGAAKKVPATGAVIEHEIDWPCQIERLYYDVNQGCRMGGAAPSPGFSGRLNMASN